MGRGGSALSKMRKLFVCGDVMTGRAIDRILPHPGSARLHERFMSSAEGYVRLAEDANGPIGAPRGFAYVWGDALAELERLVPDVRIANLETAITARGEPWPGKEVHYRMNPQNAGVLSMAKLDGCALANNHVMDWGLAGLRDTREALAGAGIAAPGAGADIQEAEAPAILDAHGVRVLVFARAMESSGVPREWAARADRAGVALCDESARSVDGIAAAVEHWRRPGDVVVLSLHWGGNWGYDIPPAQRDFAQALVDEAQVDVVYGHSSHHPRGVEVHGGRLILYGCGDFINDYEGIEGYDAFRPDIRLMYVASLDERGALCGLHVEPLRMRRFRLERASAEERRWIARTMERESRRLDTHVRLDAEGDVALA